MRNKYFDCFSSDLIQRDTMKRDMKSIKSFWFPVVFFCFVAFSAESAQIRSSKAFLRSSPEYKSDKLLTLNQGEEAAVLEERGHWRKVEARGQIGWILQMNLEQAGYTSKVSSQNLKKKNRYKSRGMRSRVARAAVGVKGLRASRVEQIKDNYDMDALKKMEDFIVDESK